MKSVTVNMKISEENPEQPVTIRFPKDLRDKAKELAQQEGLNYNQVVVFALRDAVLGKLKLPLESSQ